MSRNIRWIVGGVLGAAAIAAGAAALSATAFAGPAAEGQPGPPVVEPEVSITGDALASASAAALAAVGGGTVTQTEVGDEESYYEVEVTFADGHQVDVQLDENFALVTTIPDGSGG
jgi:hypothetical protein